MSNINKTLNKVKKALTTKGIMPLINQEQYYRDNGTLGTKYIIHYGYPKGKDVYDTVFNKIDLLKDLIEILKAGVDDG